MAVINTTIPNIAIFGEILWDLLPSGAKPGGAPMNVAYHLQQLGQLPALISRIGMDDYGKGLIDFLQAHKLGIHNIQFDKKYPTGTVPAKPNEFGEMQYDIKKPVAWDFIGKRQKNIQLVKQASYFVFGSLAARSLRSKNTLFELLEVSNKKVLDINLRPPHFNKRIITQLLNNANIIKMNLAELEMITDWFCKYRTVEERMAAMEEHFKTDVLVVTMGGNGAALQINGKVYKHGGYKVQVADTVGSGDSFLAAILSCFLQNQSPAYALQFAGVVGAYVTSQTGGCPNYTLTDIHNILKQES